MNFKLKNLSCIMFAMILGFLISSTPGQTKTLQLYILTGQSNSLGAVKGSPADKNLLKKYQSDGSTKFWHTNFNKDSGKPVDVAPPPSASWEPIVPQSCGTAASLYNCMGPEYGFAFVMEKKGWKLIPTPGKEAADIGIIKASLDGGGKQYWYKGTPAYKTIVGSVNSATAKALEDGYGKVQIAGVMYLQGESNSDASNVAKDFLTFLTNLEADISRPGVDTSHLKKQQAILGEHALWGTTNDKNPETGDITAGENGNTGEASNTSEQHRALAESRKNMGWVPTRDLAKITKGDSMGVHYDGKSQITIGARYAYEAARLAGYDTGCVRNGDTAAPLCSPKAWTNGRLPLQSPAIWDVSSSVKDNMTGTSPKEKTALFGIQIEDPYLNTVTIRGIMASTTPSLKDSSLTLGKGGITIDPGKKLTTGDGTNLKIASVLVIHGNQNWSIPLGKSIHITSSDKSQDSKGTLISGSGDIHMYSSTKLSAFPTNDALVVIDLAEPSGNAPYVGNWNISSNIKLRINGAESSSPTVILDRLTLGLGSTSLTTNSDPEKNSPILTVSGSNFLIQKDIILNVELPIPSNGKSESPVSFRIINPNGSQLAKTLNKEKFTLSPKSKGWQIDSYEASSGIITLSTAETVLSLPNSAP